VTPSHHSLFILGGARSGKSRHALSEARRAGARVAFLATAEPVDTDMKRRIARHRAERPPQWTTVEEPFDVAAACRRLTSKCDLIVIDCVTVWVSNRLARGDADESIAAAADELAKLMAERAISLIVVSNEVGGGVHPPTQIGMRFRDLLGAVNQQLAAAADAVTLMVAGIPVAIKVAPSTPSPDPRVRAFEAP
jgi:adenosylcobinamide kinase / adenosylcobinamide-phosphate guanylyltransferase